MSGRLNRMFRTASPIVMAVVLLSPLPALAQKYEMYIQCSDGGTNLNSGDLSAASVGATWADATHTDWGALYGYREAAQVPMDQTGSPSSAREHAGLVVVKDRSKSTPLYMQAMVNTTQLQCTIEFWNDYWETTRVKLFTIALVNARVNSIEYGGTGAQISETITLRAQQITWTHTQTATSFTDSLFPPP